MQQKHKNSIRCKTISTILVIERLASKAHLLFVEKLAKDFEYINTNLVIYGELR